LNKEQLLNLVSNKIKNVDADSKEVEKQFTKEKTINMEEFYKQYMAQRK
jgi:hypothetical protein